MNSSRDVQPHTNVANPKRAKDATYPLPKSTACKKPLARARKPVTTNCFVEEGWFSCFEPMYDCFLEVATIYQG